ncbi:MAG: LCP family protein [Thermoleophilia bacterium]
MGFPTRGRHYKKPVLWKRILKWTLISLLAIALTVGLAGFIFVYHTLGKIGVDTEVIYEAKQQLDIALPDEPRNILVMGTDEDPDGNSKRSDSIILVRVNPNGECMSILSIPRDLVVNIPGLGPEKINAAYATGGTPLAIDTVRELTGLPIHHFVLINYSGFEKAVDAMGGVYVDVDQRYFNDNSDAFYGEEYEPIDIYPGYQKLNGKDALAYVRYRHTDSDFMRIARQQYFIRDVKSQSLKWGNLARIPELADVFASNTTSDIGRSDVLSLTKFVITVGRDRIHQAQVPVDEMAGSGYLALSKTDLTSVIEQFQTPAFIKPEPSVPGAAAPQVPSDRTRQMSIEVYNGSDTTGAATLASQLLQQKGCSKTVVGGNYSSFAENQVFFTEGNQQAAEDLASLLNPATVSLLPADMITKSQLVVVVGSSFDGQLTEKKPEIKTALTFEQDSETGHLSWQAARLQLPFQVQKPANFPAEFDYRDFHVYEIDTDEGPKPALKVVGENEAGQAWGIMETTFTQAPLLQQPSTERDINGKIYRFYYAESNIRNISWQDGDVVCWITNTLQNSLSEDTMVQLAVSFKPVE